MRRKIQAGAGVENLRLRCPYFYNVALALHSIDGAPSVADLVISTFRSRYKVSTRPIWLLYYRIPAVWHVVMTGWRPLPT